MPIIYHEHRDTLPLEELQQDVDAWIKTYNEVRPHSGERCYGKTPMQTFLDAKHLAQEKELDKLCKTIPSVSADELNNKRVAMLVIDYCHPCQ
ncbi:hypothetical protein [Candidiatus Paracoxiella cheracis]|uniref:hypothetical protein n=1 Tax=Candidiatus Paracoxiella cheracis TaxID=3405120 RepID=UPI003BF57E28